MWSDPYPRRRAIRAGRTVARRGRGDTGGVQESKLRAHGWWRGHRSDRRAIFELLRQRRVKLPVVWGGVVSPHSSRPRARRVGAHRADLVSIPARMAEMYRIVR